MLLLGMSHHLTPLEIRQCFALNADWIQEGLMWFKEKWPKGSLIILSTCNRTEFYADGVPLHSLLQWWVEVTHTSLDLLQDHCYCTHGHEMIEHLYQVACGFKSLVIGEHQILGQLKDAYAHSSALGLLKNPFHRLFEHCFYTAKAIRATYSHGFLGPSLGQRVHEHLKKHNPTEVIVIGAGQTIHHILQKINRDSLNITICNRTDSKAASLASLFALEWTPYHHLITAIDKADAIVIATSSPIPLLEARHFRKDASCFIIDLSVPANTGKSLETRPGITVLKIDSLTEAETLEQEIYLKAAKDKVQSAIDAFKKWQKNYEHREEVKHYRKNMILSQKKLEKKALKQLSLGADPIEVLKEFSYKLTQKLLHKPSIAIKETIKSTSIY